MLIMPVVSANISQRDNHTSFGMDYILSRAAGKMIHSLAETPRLENRGLLTTLLTFLKGKDFRSLIGDSQSCYIDSVKVSDRPIRHYVGGISEPIPTDDILLVSYKIDKRDLLPELCRVQKDADVIYKPHKAKEYVQKDKQAAAELLKHLPWWKRIWL